MTTRRLFQIVSWLALAGTILPSVAFLAGSVGLPSVQWTMLAATVVWFAATPLWMGRERGAAE
ncbi:MAG: hypothetical protein JW818_17415 [Pirellulales bacterium]|nr:hypothetical protein [Pirellulales bacterium]